MYILYSSLTDILKKDVLLGNACFPELEQQ